MAKILSEREYIWSAHVWNMFDFGCAARDEGGVAGRNNKGLVTMDRKIKKDAFYLYKAYWLSLIHIWDGPIRLFPGDLVEITKANCITRLIKLSRVSFLETLRRKMI